MFYLLASLTFIATILFYSFYPRTDTVELLDKPAAKTAVAELLAQHTAALQAATIIKKTTEGKTTMAYEDWPSDPDYNNKQWDNGFPIVAEKFIPFLPAGMVRSEIPPKSVVFCTDNMSGEKSDVCAKRYVEKDENGNYTSYGTTDFVITYTTMEALDVLYGTYISNLTPRALGEAVYFTEYKDEVHLTTNCGVLEEITDTIPPTQDYDTNNATHILDNTRFETVSVPKAFTDTLDNDNLTYLVCITRISVAYGDTSCTQQENKTICNQKNEQGCYWNNTYNKCDRGIIYPASPEQGE